MARCPECDSRMNDFDGFSVCQFCDTIVSGTIMSNWTVQLLDDVFLPWEDDPMTHPTMRREKGEVL